MAGSNVIEVSEASFEADVLKSTTPVLVDFWGEGCGPCKMLVPVLNELAAEYAGKVKIAKVDVYQNTTLASQFGISSIPALFFIKGGKVVAQTVGLRSKKELKAQLDQLAA
ncbi:MAG: thioredoxin 1 [Limisphaerales bacterium]|nr:MAG: thioredoxin 1 [Limisphaerales bacterium]KAG0507294.1 MAG: thioredoxin 1 [Limisphaerales bacterium]TXT44753.1 MAG: thioredoxin 1 [Limisphaerales bacterium]